MAEGTRHNQLQERLNVLKKATDSQFKCLEMEMLGLKKGTESQFRNLEYEMSALQREVGNQLAALTLELQKKNQNQWQEESSSDVTIYSENHREQYGEVMTRSVRVEFHSFHGEDPNS